jgi:hypothetical protein
MTLISLKVDPEMLERIDADAKAHGISRTALLLQPWDKKIAVTLGNDPTIRYIRPKHSIDCKCLMCKPPNPSKS